MEKIPRHLFIPTEQVPHAYDDGPLPIGSGQTISQPYMVARMSELLALDGESRVLEVGTGSGYQTAVLAELAKQVFTMERLPELTAKAKSLLLRLGYTNIEFISGDGSIGYPEAAPYEAILVTAAAPRVPDALLEQMVIGGRMVIPVGAGQTQQLMLIERLDNSAESHDTPSTRTRGEHFRETKVLDCVFVPLVGKQGFSA